MAQFCGDALIEGFCSGPAKLGMTVGQGVCYGSRPWDPRRVARLDVRMVFAARVRRHADGRGCFCLTTCCYSGRVQQGVNSVVLERMTQFGVKWQGCGELGTRASGDAWVVLHSHGV